MSTNSKNSYEKELRLKILGVLDDNQIRSEIGLPTILGWKCTTCNCVCTEYPIFKYHHVPGTDKRCDNPIVERLTSYFDLLEANETVDKIISEKLTPKKITFREWL